MPKELTHWIVADRSLAGLDNTDPMAQLIRQHRGLFLAGAVLPDTLLHLFRGPCSKEAIALSASFHDAEENSYLPLIRLEEEFGGKLPPPLMACLLGVLSHMQTDIVFHPFIFACGGTSDMGSHYRLETDIDVRFIAGGSLPPALRLADLVDASIHQELVEALILLFDPERRLPYTAAERALDLHCRFQSMYDKANWKIAAQLLGRLPASPFHGKQHLFYPLWMPKSERLEGEGKWLHPVTGLPQHSTLDDLADQAVARSVAIFNAIAQAGGLTAVLVDAPGENLLTGLHATRRQHMAPGPS